MLCAGDAFYEYRFSNEVIDLLQSNGARYVLGNHESVLLDPRGVRARGAATVAAGHVAWVAEQPLSIEVDVGGGKKLVMVHASPLEPYTQYVFPKSPELARPRRSKPTTSSSATPTRRWSSASAAPS